MRFAIRDRFIEAINTYVKGNLGICDKIISGTLGISEDTLAEILNKETPITLDVISKFLMAYPDIDCEWLIIGWNEMLKEKVSSVENYTTINNHSNNIDSNNKREELSIQKKHYEDLINSLERTIALQERVIDHLKEENNELKK